MVASRKRARSSQIDFELVVPMIGRRGDDPDLWAFMKAMGKRPLKSDRFSRVVDVVCKNHGVALGFSYLVAHRLYPVIESKKPGAYVPYLVAAGFGDDTPLAKRCGIGKKATKQAIIKKLGPPALTDAPDLNQWWHVPLDRKRGVGVTVSHNELDDVFFGLNIDCRPVLVEPWVTSASPVFEGPDAENHEVSYALSRSNAGVLVAWLVEHSLIDEAHFKKHAKHFDAVRARRMTGGELLGCAMPQGLWMDHIRDLPGLRPATRWWLESASIEPYLEIFGAFDDGPAYGSPALLDDSWETVDRASPAIEKHFARWVSFGRDPR